MAKTKITKPENSNRRAEGSTQISISLPDSLVKRIDRLAKFENRNRSNFISNEMSFLVERREAELSV